MRHRFLFRPSRSTGLQVLDVSLVERDAAISDRTGTVCEAYGRIQCRYSPAPLSSRRFCPDEHVDGVVNRALRRLRWRRWRVSALGRSRRGRLVRISLRAAMRGPKSLGDPRGCWTRLVVVVIGSSRHANELFPRLRIAQGRSESRSFLGAIWEGVHLWCADGCENREMSGVGWFVACLLRRSGAEE